MAKRIVMDVDTGTDDALALLYAMAHPDIEVLGISCVAGNCGLEQVIVNTQRVLDAAGAGDIPVAGGASRPLIERTRAEGRSHGANGLGGIGLPESRRTRSRLPAVEMLYQQIIRSAEPVTLVGLAPQTNLALLISQHPDVADHLDRIVFMGGSAGVGNMTAIAEFNVWQDPEAAACVTESGIAITMYGLDVFAKVLVGQDVADRFRRHADPAVHLVGELLYRRASRADGAATHYLGQIGDAGALVMLTNPELFTVRPFPVRVNLTGLGRGQTIVDQRPVAQTANQSADDPWPVLDVVLDFDREEPARAFARTVEQLAG